MARHRKQTKIKRGCAGLFLAFAIVVAAFWGAGLGVLNYILDEDSGQTIRAVEDFRPRVGSRVYSSDGEFLGEFFNAEARQLLPLNEVPLILQKAFLATEDHAFYEHKGVQPLALAAVGVDVLQGKRARGASTITQQIVRNIEATGITKEETIQRKLREMLVAIQLEREFTKDEILELYLNQIFLGISAYGVEAAAQQYFGKTCSELTLGESATLAGLTRAPNANEPIQNPNNARIRRDIVLTQMLDNGFITQAEFDAAKAEDLAQAVVTPEERATLAEQGQATWDPKRFQAPYFVEEVRQFITSPPPPYETKLSTQQILEEGLQVHTTIDMRLQRAAEEILIRHMDEFDTDRREWLAKRKRSEEFIPISAALMCLDNRPGVEGFVRAMVGGRNFAEKKFNMATQAERQPGSSVKPFVWLAAIDNGMTCSTVIVDEPFSRVDGAGNMWTPKNFGGEYLGPIPISLALEKSVNVISVKLVERLGMPLVRSYLRDAGFKRPIEDIVGLTLGLGTPVTTILDHAVCYSTLAHNGTRYDPVMVTDIQDRDGFTLYDYRDFRQKEVDALPPDATFTVVRMMQGVCEADYKRNHYPTGWRTQELERPRAGKTGTTNLSKDLWFCGFTPQFTCIVWFGYEDNSSLGTGRDFTGGHVSQPVWTEFMKVAHEGLPVEDFTVPPGVEFFNVERMTGVAGADWKAAFIRGARPPEEFTYDTLLDVEQLLEEL